MSLTEGLHNIAPSSIDFDYFNPRGETVEQIINDEEFHKLKDSISRIGVLVPLIVKRSNTLGSKQYILIDGERRLRATLDLNLDSVPVRITDSDIEGNIIAYQIHQNRKAWSKPSEAKSIKKIIDSIKKDIPNISESELKKKLIEVTSHRPTSINDILKILKYDEETQEKSAKGDIEHSYLIRIEDDFITPLRKCYSEIIDTFGENEIRIIMIRKAELKLLINTRYMMNSNFKEIFKPSLIRDKICLLIGEFLQSPEKSISDLYKEFEHLQAKERNKTHEAELSNLDNLTNDTSNTSVESNPAIPQPAEKNNIKQKIEKSETENSSNSVEPHNLIDKKATEPVSISATNSNKAHIIISKAKKSGFNAIKESLEEFGKQYSEEELEYIKEAIVCLASEKALKASVLMIWASSISRILKYIEKDIPKFNATCDAMQKEKKSFYKFYAATFQKNATLIEEIKEQARDMQLLCYLCYEGVMTQSQFKQLKGHYEIRNECAHPTSLKLSMNEVLAIFENLIKFIFNNSQLK